MINGWGIAKPVLLGTDQGITSARARALAVSCIIIIPFFIMGLFYFGHYLQIRRNLSFLFFSLMAICTSIALSMFDLEGMIYIPFPWIPLWLHARLELIFFILGILMALYSFTSYYRTLISRHMLWLITVYASILVTVSLISIRMPSWYYLVFVLPFTLFIFIYSMYIIVLAAIRRMEGSRYLVICGLFLNVYSITAVINASSTNQILIYNVLSVLGVILSLSLLMAKQFNSTFFKAKSLAQKLRQIDVLKDQFIVRTAHEFREPLSGIITSAQTLLKSDKRRLIQDEQITIQRITRMCYRLSNLVGDILDLEKINQGLLNVKTGPVDVRSLINLEIGFYTKMTEEKGLQFIDQMPRVLPLVLADGNRLRQILNHLLDNAIKYTHCGTITLSAKQKKNHLEIMVADTGTGIPASEHDTLFDPIRQADTHASEGAGLGLAITKKLVELQQGKIWFESKSGSGTTFHFTVPLYASNRIDTVNTLSLEFHTSQNQMTHQTQQKPDSNKRQTILAVDDDPEQLKILTDMLKSLDYHVISVKSGDEALHEVVRSMPDLVVLNLMMSGMSGFKICGKIREKYGLTELPILMLTTSIINEDKHYAIRSGANDVLPRPYTFSEFSARIRSLILMKQAASQAAHLEVAFLQSQIRPHFLYNVLNSIIALSYEDIEKAREMTAQFAAYLRGSFAFQNTSAMSTLKKELSLVHAYLAIEKMRFQDRIHATINVDDTLDFPLPPLTIQPLIENAIRHGIGKRKNGGRLSLSITHKSGYFLITVSDNGAGMDEKEIRNVLLNGNGHSVGLKNINSRLKHFYGTELQISSSPGNGATVTVHIPEKQGTRAGYYTSASLRPSKKN